jgi:hypothetical protein
MAPEVGLEPTTNRLTADRSTTELLRNEGGESKSYAAKRINPFATPTGAQPGQPYPHSRAQPLDNPA